MRRTALLFVVLLLATLVPVGSVGAASPPTDPATGQGKSVTRIAGAGRLETAVAVSASSWPDGATTALLATAGAFPDALAAGGLAAAEEAPLLLTAGERLPAVVAGELRRLGVSEVVILGGERAVPAAVEADVRGLPGGPSTRRLAGADRFATAARIATAAGAPSGAVTVASGESFPDALSAASLSASPDRLPSLLVQVGGVPDPTRDVLVELAPRSVTVIGGASAVGGSVMDAIAATGAAVDRLAGDSRFTTSQAVVAAALDRFDATPRPLLIATGGDFPDALAAGAMAARAEGPLLLVPGDGLTPGLDRFIRSHHERFSRAIVIGGAGAVSERVLEQVGFAIDDAEAPRPEPPDPRTADLSGQLPAGEKEIGRTVAPGDDGTPGVLLMSQDPQGEGQGGTVTANLFRWGGAAYERIAATSIGCEYSYEVQAESKGGALYLQCFAGANLQLLSAVHAEGDRLVLHPRSAGDGYDGWMGYLEERIPQEGAHDDIVIAQNSCDPSCSHGNYHHWYLFHDDREGAYFAYGLWAWWGDWYDIDPPANVSWEYQLRLASQARTFSTDDLRPLEPRS